MNASKDQSSDIPNRISGVKWRKTMTTITYGRETARNKGTDFAPGVMGRVKTYFARSRAERQLNQLDDRMLADIGVRRSEIEKMVWGN
jgi:uncharacterized protein YjiS (DUF1127 family)